MILTRCSNGAACLEVTARLEAAHRLKYLEDDPECAAVMFAKAALIAEVHRQEAELEEAS